MCPSRERQTSKLLDLIRMLLPPKGDIPNTSPLVSSRPSPRRCVWEAPLLVAMSRGEPHPPSSSGTLLSPSPSNQGVASALTSSDQQRRAPLIVKPRGSPQPVSRWTQTLANQDTIPPSAKAPFPKATESAWLPSSSLPPRDPVSVPCPQTLLVHPASWRVPGQPQASASALTGAVGVPPVGSSRLSTERRPGPVRVRSAELQVGGRRRATPPKWRGHGWEMRPSRSKPLGHRQ